RLSGGDISESYMITDGFARFCMWQAISQQLSDTLLFEYTYMAEALDFECEVLVLIDKPSVEIIYEIMELI
ncbi:hypothetical protein ACPV3W_22220, partial [Vibrio parahaemolyticus]